MIDSRIPEGDILTLEQLRPQEERGWSESASALDMNEYDSNLENLFTQGEWQDWGRINHITQPYEYMPDFPEDHH